MNAQPPRIAILIFPDVEELDFVGVFEMLCRPGRMGTPGAPKVHLVGTQSQIRCRNGLTVRVDRIYAHLEEYDLLVVPGGQGVRPLMGDEGFIGYLQTFPRDRLIASVCTGSWLLGKAGFLSGRRATSHHLWLEELQSYCREVVQERVVEDGNVITSGGVASSIDLGLFLVEKLLGAEVRAAVAEILEIRAMPYE